MKHAILLRATLLALLIALVPASALAFNHYSVDAEALKALEQTDTFDVRITKKVVADGVGSDSNNRDMLTLTVENASPYTLREVYVQVLCHDAEGHAQELQREGGLSLITTQDPRSMFVGKFFDLAVAPGDSTQLNIACCHSNFTGVRALVAQVVTDEGETLTNPLFAQWQELALGSPTHILD